MKLMMNYNSKQTLNENKFSTLLSSNNDNNFVITDMMSPDNRYFVFLDEMYDLKEQRKLGNFWDSIDNITLFLRHSFKQATNIPQNIRESCLSDLKKISLNESLNSDLYLIKEHAREMVKRLPLNERTWGEWASENASDFKSWLGRSATNFVTGTTQMVKDAGTGAVQLGKAVMSGDALKVLELLKKGVIYFAQWLRRTLYNPIGMVLDTVLVVTGIGKSVQWIPWAIVVALDVYELLNPKEAENQNEPLWAKALSIGSDVLGLVMAGAAAKAAKLEVESLKGVIAQGPEAVAQAIAKNPALEKTLNSMMKGVEKVPGFLEKAVEFLMKPFPKAAEWIKGLLGNITSFISKFTESLGKIFSTKGAKTAGKELAINYGMEKATEAGIEMYQKMSGAGERAGADIAKSAQQLAPQQAFVADAEKISSGIRSSGPADYTDANLF
jgi:hypothetical protein